MKKILFISSVLFLGTFAQASIINPGPASCKLYFEKQGDDFLTTEVESVLQERTYDQCVAMLEDTENKIGETLKNLYSNNDGAYITAAELFGNTTEGSIGFELGDTHGDQNMTPDLKIFPDSLNATKVSSGGTSGTGDVSNATQEGGDATESNTMTSDNNLTNDDRINSLRTHLLSLLQQLLKLLQVQ